MQKKITNKDSKLKLPKRSSKVGFMSFEIRSLSDSPHPYMDSGSILHEGDFLERGEISRTFVEALVPYSPFPLKPRLPFLEELN